MRDAVEVVRRSAAAMAAVHARGVIHRDLKLSNIFLIHGRGTAIKLIDFGVVKPPEPTSSPPSAGRSSARPTSWPPSRPAGRPSTRAPTCTRSGRCCSAWSPGATSSRPSTSSRCSAAWSSRSRRSPPACASTSPRRSTRSSRRAIARQRDERYENGGELARALARVGTLNNDPPATDRSASAIRKAVPDLSPPSSGDTPATRPRRGPAPASGAWWRWCSTISAAPSSPPRSTPRCATCSARTPASRRSPAGDGGGARRRALQGRRGHPRGPGGAPGLARARGRRGRGARGDRRRARGARAGQPGGRGARPGRAPARRGGARHGAHRRPRGRRDRGALRGPGATPKAASWCARTPAASGRASSSGGPRRRWAGTKEIALLLGIYNEMAEDGTPRAALVSGSAGIGKSRVRAEMMARLEAAARRPEILLCRGDAMSRGSSLSALGRALRALMGVHDGEQPHEQITKVKNHVAVRLPRTLRFLAAFLGELIGVPFPDEHDEPLRAARASAQLMQSRMRSALEAFARAQPHAAGPLHRGHALGRRHHHRSRRLAPRLPRPPLRRLRLRPAGGADPPPPALGAPQRHPAHALAPLAARRRAPRRRRAPAGRALGARQRGAPRRRQRPLPGRADPLRRRGPGGAAAHRAGPGAGPARSHVARAPPGAARGGGLRPVVLDRRRRGAPRSPRGDRPRRAPWPPRSSPGRTSRASSGEDEWIFRQALVRDAAYASILEEDRAAMHLAAGAWLESVGDVDVGLIARHADAGGDLPRAAALYARATRQAYTNGAQLETALELADRGLACGAEGGVRGQLLIAKAQVSSFLGRLTEPSPPPRRPSRLAPPGSDLWGEAQRIVATALIEAGRSADGDARAAWALGPDFAGSLPAHPRGDHGRARARPHRSRRPRPRPRALRPGPRHRPRLGHAGITPINDFISVDFPMPFGRRAQRFRRPAPKCRCCGGPRFARTRQKGCGFSTWDAPLMPQINFLDLRIILHRSACRPRPAPCPDASRDAMGDALRRISCRAR